MVGRAAREGRDLGRLAVGEDGTRRLGLFFDHAATRCGAVGHALRRRLARLHRAVLPDAQRLGLRPPVHERRAEATHGRHDRHVRVARDRVDAERDAGHVGVDHGLDHDGRRRRRSVEAARRAIRPHARRDRRPPHVGHALGDAVGRDEQERFELSGERVLRPVLVRRRRPDGHERRVPQPGPPVGHRRRHLRRWREPGESVRQRFGRRVATRGLRPHRRLVGREAGAERGRAEGDERRDREPGLRETGERGALAAPRPGRRRGGVGEEPVHRRSRAAGPMVV